MASTTDSPKSPDQHLLLFTKYPLPNFAKTRLVPALGPQGAARFSLQLTKHTLSTIQQFVSDHQHVLTTVYYAAPLGTSSATISTWIPSTSNRMVLSQSSGDLGCRLQTAFSNSFCNGANQAIVIGSDAPALTPSILSSAFDALSTYDVVIGPAADGGYYLLGMQTLHTSLFQNIPWSTSKVLSTTLLAAQVHGLSVFQLPVLRDVDNPSDLEFAREILSIT